MSAATWANNESLSEWETEGLALGERERSAESLMWDIGDWWNRGERYGDRVAVVHRQQWTGPQYGTCRNAGTVAKAWDVSRRHDRLSYDHHRIAAPLLPVVADQLLDWCEEPIAETGEPRSTRELAAEIKRGRRAERIDTLASAEPVEGIYHVIYADPPWRFEPFSRDSGMDRAADNHYPTMDVDGIKALEVPAADDAVLFLWATAPMLPEALEVMAAWGFEYKSHCIWAKDVLGTGYWFRSLHELLLVGTRGDIPAPAPGTQYASVIELAVGEHSAKPVGFAEMIEELYPGLRLLEMFARGPRLGWTVWGNEAAAQDAAA
jgi:N6-adenosine-specific RNA methylase IME4